MPYGYFLGLCLAIFVCFLHWNDEIQGKISFFKNFKSPPWRIRAGVFKETYFSFCFIVSTTDREYTLKKTLHYDMNLSRNRFLSWQIYDAINTINAIVVWNRATRDTFSSLKVTLFNYFHIPFFKPFLTQLWPKKMTLLKSILHYHTIFNHINHYHSNKVNLKNL